MNYSAIIVAAGRGERAGLTYNKVLRNIAGDKVLVHALKTFFDDDGCTEIIVVTSEADLPVINAETSRYQAQTVIGGKTRRESVNEGLKKVSNSYVLVHDAARPFIAAGVIGRIKDALRHYDAVSPALAVPDTLKKVENGIIVDDLDRTGVYGLQTPQAFATHVLREAHTLAQREGIDATCDLTLATHVTGVRGIIVEGDPRSLKYTRERDLALLELILNESNRTKP